MSRLKQSISWWCFAKENPRTFLPEVRKLGISAVELAPVELFDEIKSAGLAISAHGVGSLTEGLNNPRNHDKIEEELQKALETFKKYQIPNAIVFSGNRNGLDDETGAMNTAQGLRKLAPHAEKAGVTLVLELLNSKVDHIDYQCDSTPWGVKVVQHVNSPAVKLLYDIYHMQIMEGDLIRTIKQNVKYFGHVHTAGNPGRHDLDSDQEIFYPPLMRALAEGGYQGYVGHEFMPKGAALPALRMAYDLCAV